MRELHTIETQDWLAKIDPLHGANCVVLRNKKYAAALLRDLPDGITPDNPCPTGEVNRVVKGVILYPYTLN